MQALRERILEALKKEPLTDEELQQKFNAPRASVRRSRQELVKQGLVKKAAGGHVGGRWGLVDTSEVKEQFNDIANGRDEEPPAEQV